MEPTEALAVIVALLAGFLTGRRTADGGGMMDGVEAVTRPVRAAGRLTVGTGAQIGSRGVSVARRIASGAGDLSGVGIDAARGAAAGAGFGFLQFRAARHVRAHPPRPARATTRTDPAREVSEGVPSEPGAGSTEAGDGSPASGSPARPRVLVTGGTRFHRPGCSAVRGDARELSRDEALAEGRVPCRSCNP